jgi:hypothetical protein
MIDFTNAIEEFNNYRGSEKKKTLIYNSRKYLVKFPDPVREKNKNISYINNAFSEYIGSNIFKIVGFKVQNTILGKYKYKEKEKVVCACEDFTDDNNVLYEFENLALSTNPDKKIETEIKDIMEVIEENKMINTEETKQKFWDMFVIDSLIGNTDRHNGNWGFILNKNTGKVEFSPIYDCGSALNPMLEDEEIERLNETELKNLAINCYSCLKENGKKINYITYIKEMKNEECNVAIKKLFLNINIDEINKFINNIDCISTERKEFYKKIIEKRYSILRETYKNIK